MDIAFDCCEDCSKDYSTDQNNQDQVDCFGDQIVEKSVETDPKRGFAHFEKLAENKQEYQKTLEYHPTLVVEVTAEIDREQVLKHLRIL